ncbi:MAG: sigma-70 family RNA polymerase sigma factor [Gemmataceae bacterium]
MTSSLSQRLLPRSVGLDDWTDAQLIERFRRFRCPASFEALVRRHAGLVRGVCRCILADPNAADDAFQATFLVLFRKIDSIHCDSSLSSWLYTVARHAALRVMNRQSRFESLPPETASGRDALSQITGRELCRILDEELQRLPANYRLPVVLCCVEGLTRDEAAQRLGWTVQALKGRLERGRQRLRLRLDRRGLGLPAALAAVSLAAGAGRSAAAIRAVSNQLAGRPAAEPIEQTCKEVVRIMRASRSFSVLKVAALVVATTGFIVAAGSAIPSLLAQPPRAPAEAPKAKPPAAENPIRGEWQSVATGMSFSLMPADSCTITDTAFVLNPGGRQTKFSYKIDAKKVPPTIDLSPLEGPDKGKTYPGIFSRDGEFLEICYDDRPEAKRPAAFSTMSDLGGSRLLVLADGKMFAPASLACRSRYNMKIVGEAILGYAKDNGHLPPAYSADNAGTPLLSWRLTVCPYMQQSNLFKAFHKDEAWNSAHNDSLSVARIKVYMNLPGGHPNLSLTRYRVFEGPGTLFPGMNSTKLPAAELLPTTILVAEAKGCVVWTKPEELPYAADKPLPELGGVLDDGFHVVLADCSVKFVKNGFNEKVFRQMVLRDKAKPVRWEDLSRK